MCRLHPKITHLSQIENYYYIFWWRGTYDSLRELWIPIKCNANPSRNICDISHHHVRRETALNVWQYLGTALLMKPEPQGIMMQCILCQALFKCLAPVSPPYATYVHTTEEKWKWPIFYQDKSCSLCSIFLLHAPGSGNVATRPSWHFDHPFRASIN